MANAKPSPTQTGGNTSYGGLIKSGGKGSVIVSFPANGNDRCVLREYSDLWEQLVAKKMFLDRDALRAWGDQPKIYWFAAGSYEQAARWCCVWTGIENSPTEDWFFPWVENVWTEQNEQGQWESLLFAYKTETLGFGQTLELAYLHRFNIPYQGACFKLYHETDKAKHPWLDGEDIWSRSVQSDRSIICLHPCARIDPAQCCSPQNWQAAQKVLDDYQQKAQILRQQAAGMGKQGAVDSLIKSWRLNQRDSIALSKVATLAFRNHF